MGLLAVVLLALPACTGLPKLLDHVASGDPEGRQEALLVLEKRLRRMRPSHPRHAEARAQIDRFLLTNFGQEPLSVLREQYISLALQGELPGTAELLQQGVADGSWNVRLTAVKGLGRLNPPETRNLLTEVLRKDSTLLVRIEAAKSFRFAGDSSWARPLVELLVDEAEEPNLRRQAWLSAVQLTGKDLPYVPELWRKVLESDVQ